MSDNLYGPETLPRNNTKYIVLHGSFTTVEEDLNVKEIDLRDRAQGRYRIGYHYVVRRDGTVQQGRPQDLVGNHCGLFNQNAVSICFVGGKSPEGLWEDNYTASQEIQGELLIQRLRLQYGVSEVVSYCDMPGTRTKSPGFSYG